jgi:hypothetical protein
MEQITMTFSAQITPDNNEIKLYYQLFSTKENLSSHKENWKPLTKDSDIQFAEDVLEDLQNRNLSEAAIQKLNTAIEKEELYFKVFRDDKDKIPENAQLLHQVRILPDQGLLDLDETLKTKISDWTPSFVTQAIETASTWAWNNLPALKANNISKLEIFSAESEEEYFSADEFDDYDEIISETVSQKSETESVEPTPASKSKHTTSFFQKALNSAWQLSSYILQNPAKAMTLMLATQVVAATALGELRKPNPSISSAQSPETPQSETSTGVQLHTDNPLAQVVTQPGIFPAEIALSSLDGVNGFKLTSNDIECSVSSTGDINDDGIADILVGGWLDTASDSRVNVVFGQRGVWPPSFALSSLNGANGFALLEASAWYGSCWSVSGAGDINGDGISDMLVGGSSINNNTGAAYVVFGQKSAWSATFSLSNLNGVNGFMLMGGIVGDSIGSPVSSAGDINGDGIADILVGARVNNINNFGAVYVVFGQKSGWPATLALSSLDGTNGFTMMGISAGDGIGSSVSSAGDINGDGIADILLGAPFANNRAGATYVVFGQRGVWPATLSLSSLNGANGFTLTGINAGDVGDLSGSSVSSAGDINGDGIADILLGAPGANNLAGVTYVVFGQRGIWPATLSLSSLNGANGFKLMGGNADDESGGAVISSAGDINGDGIADILVGAPGANVIYAVFGQKSVWPATLLLSSLNGVNGFMLMGSVDGTIGSSMSSAGDVNDDGIADILVGESSGSTTYVVFGHPSPKIYTNTLTILQGARQILSAENLNVTCDCTDIPDLMLTIENIEHGQFEWIKQPGNPVFSFQQQQIWSGQLQFVHDGSIYPPAYIVRLHITQFFNTTAYEASTITFTPVLFQNQLSVNQGQSVVLNTNNLHASYQNTLPANILFSITAVQNGHFYWTGFTQTPLTLFSQQNVTEGKVQFTTDGSTQAPQYSVTVLANNVVQTGEIRGSITFYYLMLLQNNLVINQGQSIALTQANFYANDSNPNITLNDIVFDFLSVQHGYFSFVSSAQTPATRFTQQNITAQIVQFTQDNSALSPIYFFTVTDSYGAQLPTIAGSVNFDSNPILVRNQLTIGQADNVILSNNELNATHWGISVGSLRFVINNLAHGNFYYANNPDVFVTTFYQDNITKRLVVFSQDGTIRAPLYQVSVTDERISTSYQNANITFYLTPIPTPSPLPTSTAIPSISPSPLPSLRPTPTVAATTSPIPVSPISPQASDPSLDPLLIKGLITGGISGAVGLFFLLVKIYLSHQAQKKLNKMSEEKEGVNKELVDYKNNVIRPIASEIFNYIKITGFADYISNETMSEYFSAIETLAGELSRKNILINFSELSTQEKHRIIHEIAKQTKSVLVPKTEGCCNMRFFRVCPEVTPMDIEGAVSIISERVLLNLHAVDGHDGDRELDSTYGRSDEELEEGEQSQRQLIA